MLGGTHSLSLLATAYLMPWRRSAPINIEDVGVVYLRVFPPGAGPNEPRLIRAEVAIEVATIFVTLKQETGPWPFALENDSDSTLIVGQVVSLSYELPLPVPR